MLERVALCFNVVRYCGHFPAINTQSIEASAGFVGVLSPLFRTPPATADDCLRWRNARNVRADIT
jgi:hypothetical protein